MKQIVYLISLLVLFTPRLLTAAPWTITDAYIGGGYKSDYAHNDGDVIAGNSSNRDRQETYIDEFDIDGMIVDIDGGGNITVAIITDYDPNISGSGTTYGDLFISTDGWDPNRNSTYDTSQDGSGEFWEFVFDTDTRRLYRTNGGTALLSQNFFGPGSGALLPDEQYRKNQLVQINADALTSQAITTGTFAAGPDGPYDNVLVYSGFNLEDLGLSRTGSLEMAFRWTMTCANDVIEGRVNRQPIPEPGSMALLGFGLLGLGAVGRRKWPPARLSNADLSTGD